MARVRHQRKDHLRRTFHVRLLPHALKASHKNHNHLKSCLSVPMAPSINTDSDPRTRTCQRTTAPDGTVNWLRSSRGKMEWMNFFFFFTEGRLFVRQMLNIHSPSRSGLRAFLDKTPCGAETHRRQSHHRRTSKQISHRLGVRRLCSGFQ